MDRIAFEDLIQLAAGDGDVAPIGRRSAAGVEIEELLRAWSIERGHCIECESLLKLSRLAIAQLLAADRGLSTPAHLRNLRALLRQIDSQLNAGAPERA